MTLQNFKNLVDNPLEFAKIFTEKISKEPEWLRICRERLFDVKPKKLPDPPLFTVDLEAMSTIDFGKQPPSSIVYITASSASGQVLKYPVTAFPGAVLRVDDVFLMRDQARPCEACEGTGIFDGEECWHCEGECVDPTR